MVVDQQVSEQSFNREIDERVNLSFDYFRAASSAGIGLTLATEHQWIALGCGAGWTAATVAQRYFNNERVGLAISDGREKLKNYHGGLLSRDGLFATAGFLFGYGLNKDVALFGNLLSSGIAWFSAGIAHWNSRSDLGELEEKL